jgi:hypothetical protein
MVSGLERLAHEQHAREKASRKSAASQTDSPDGVHGPGHALRLRRCHAGDAVSDPAGYCLAVMDNVSKRPCLRGVLLPFRSVIGDSRAWLRERPGHAHPHLIPLDHESWTFRSWTGTWSHLDAALRVHAAHSRVALFVRFCGLETPWPGPGRRTTRGGGGLCVETLSFVLDVLFALHEEVRAIARD